MLWSGGKRSPVGLKCSVNHHIQKTVLIRVEDIHGIVMIVVDGDAAQDTAAQLIC